MPRIRRRRNRAVTITAPRPAAPRIETVEEAGLRWIQMDAPGADEIAWLDESFDFNELDFEDIQSRRQRPKVDDYPDYLFVVLHFPWYDKDTQRLYPAELNAFIGRDYVITLPNTPLKPLVRLQRRIAEDAELRQEYFAKGSGYLFYEILDALYGACFPMLDQIGRKLDDIEDGIFEGRSEDLVRRISGVKQEIISYRKIVKPQRAALRLLERDTERFLPEDLEIYYDDLVDSQDRIWDALENYKEVIDALESTNETEIAHRQNRVLRLLTVFSVVMLPLTFVTGLFGMNVRVPWQGDIAGFWLIVAGLVAGLSLMVLLLRRNRWL